ncbi:MAG: esterase-like activity of phytase family protein [Gammaproteobacteria bacterium]|nr:esterase-like activity of phytase family protein [Gammaproteobacteria bacterium]
MARFLLTVFLCILAYPVVHGTDLRAKLRLLSDEVIANHSKKGLLLLGVLEIGNVSVNGITISEMSGLAWDEDEQILYAVSDRGYIVHFRPVFDNSSLVDVIPAAIHVLRDHSGRPLSGHFIDSEGLEAVGHDNRINGDTELLVSFERTPRIDRYTPDGRYRAPVTIPEQLATPGSYKNRNTALESITIHDRYGIIMAPEKLSRSYPPSEFQLFATDGRMWSFATAGATAGSITGLTTTAEGNLIALERIFHNVITGFSFALHHMQPAGLHWRHEKLLRIGPEDGFFNDNFEGISRHRANYFFMISDDNNSALQRSLLVYFKLTAL